MHKDNVLFYIVVLFTIIVILHFIYWLFCIGDIHYLMTNPSLADKGTLGDLLSGHFSALAFIWFVYGVYLQRKEFELIRKEHHDHNDEFKEQSKIYTKQSLLMLSQWLNDWINTLKVDIKKEVSENKTDIFIVIGQEQTDTHTFKNQCEEVKNKYALIANKETFILIKNFFIEVERISNIIETELSEESYKVIFKNKLKSNFDVYLKKFEYCYFIAIMSQIVMQYNAKDKVYPFIQKELSKQIVNDFFFEAESLSDAKRIYKETIKKLHKNQLNIEKYNIRLSLVSEQSN